MDALEYRREAEREYRRLETLAEKAIAQVTDEDFFRTLEDDGNSLAILLKHMAGNLRSRWQDFLTTDGEKPDRDRDAEFEVHEDDSRDAVMQRWEQGWEILFAAIGPLTEQDFERRVTIRGEPLTVLQAIQRQLTHYAYHVGQIVQLARHFAGPAWQSLSIPRGKSQEFNADPRRWAEPHSTGEKT